MKVGFTGTQGGMTDLQEADFRKFLTLWGDQMTEFHHGSCIGSDYKAHLMVRRFLPHVRIIVHPPTIARKVAACEGGILLPPRPYLDRNHDIVNATTYLVATPKEVKEVLRSGTWATVRYAQKMGRPVEILLPR
jgi:hypothetical protein